MLVERFNFRKMSAFDSIDKNRVPQHVAIIMDGNGRWAKRHGKERVFGHQAGVDSVDKVTEAASNLGVKYLTLYAFSTENWNRPKAEVDALMEILAYSLRAYINKISSNNVRLRVIGDIDNLTEKAQENLRAAIQETEQNTGLNLVLALNYSARWEITAAAKKIATDAKNGVIQPEDITETTFPNYLATQGMPDPDLLIRTSGELRISNFLLWQLSYAELYFTDVCWPDFKGEQFFEAVLDYQKRERRYGKTSEQVQNENV